MQRERAGATSQHGSAARGAVGEGTRARREGEVERNERSADCEREQEQVWAGVCDDAGHRHRARAPLRLGVQPEAVWPTN